MTKIFICTPAYGNKCDLKYVESLIKTKDFFDNKEIDVEFSFIGYESLIPRGRNTFVSRFLADPSNTHLLFIDADIVWNPKDILKLLLDDKNLIGGIYPQKKYNWDKIKQIETISDIPKLLNYNLNSIKGITSVENGIIQLKHIATGFMMIKRKVFIDLIKHFPEKKYCNDINASRNAEEEKYLYGLFHCDIVDGHYLSEDYFFCDLWQKIGGEVYADLSINLNHIGRVSFKGKPSLLVNK